MLEEYMGKRTDEGTEISSFFLTEPHGNWTCVPCNGSVDS